MQPGHVVAGKYRIEQVLGAGGMGVVAAATHLDLGSLVAIKFLLPDALKNPEIVDRFNREARVAVKIRSEHAIRVIDVGHLETGAPYIVMEHLEGQDLDQRLEEDIRIPVPEAVDKILQASEALAEAHALDIVHRDIKPENLFVTRRADGTDCVKVLDFGIAKMAETSVSGHRDLTQTSAFLGSPSYMSPEQLASSRDVDARADVWALGVSLYKLVTGSSPFIADSISALVLAVVQRAPISLAELCPDAPAGLEEAVAKCFEKDREDRYADVGEMARALAPFGTDAAASSVDRIERVLSRSVSANREDSGGVTTHADVFPQVAASEVPAPPGTQVTFGLTKIRSTGRLGGTKGALAILGVLALLGAGGFVLTRADDAATPAGNAEGESDSAPGPAHAPVEAAAALPEPAPAPDAPPPGEAAAPLPAKITLSIQSTPPGANVYQQPDRVRVGRTPYQMSVAPTNGELVFIVSKPGYESEEVVLAAGETNTAKIVLRKRPKAKAPSASKKAQPKRPPSPAPSPSSAERPGSSHRTVNPFAN